MELRLLRILDEAGQKSFLFNFYPGFICWKIYLRKLKHQRYACAMTVLSYLVYFSSLFLFLLSFFHCSFLCSIHRFRQLQISSDSKIADCQNEAKQKAFELDRVQMLHEELLNNGKQLGFQNDTLSKKMEVC